MEIPNIPFSGFQKISRYSRQVIVTEKIDGTNAQIFIDDSGNNIYAGSRTRWIVPGDDNFGFAAWVEENKTELLRLGPGNHFGEWWGRGIQRSYGLKDRRFSLFNVSRWGVDATRPKCCHVVPTLWTGDFDDLDAAAVLASLKDEGSRAAPGFMNPEGIVIFCVAGGQLFKKTIEKDAGGKGE